MNNDLKEQNNTTFVNMENLNVNKSIPMHQFTGIIPDGRIPPSLASLNVIDEFEWLNSRMCPITGKPKREKRYRVDEFQYNPIIGKSKCVKRY